MNFSRNFTDVCENVKIRWELQKNCKTLWKINSVKFPNLVTIFFRSEWIVQSSPYWVHTAQPATDLPGQGSRFRDQRDSVADREDLLRCCLAEPIVAVALGSWLLANCLLWYDQGFFDLNSRRAAVATAERSCYLNEGLYSIGQMQISAELVPILDTFRISPDTSGYFRILPDTSGYFLKY